MIERSNEVGFFSSIELARLANVSQPSVTRFAAALGFDGFLEMRRHLRSGSRPEPDAIKEAQNRFQAAALSESQNLAKLAETLGDVGLIQRFGQALAASRPLPVLSLRAAAALGRQFQYFGAKVHPDIRLIGSGGSMIEDKIEQAAAAGASHLLAFLMPLYPREAVQALRFARQAGLHVIIVADLMFDARPPQVDLALLARVNFESRFQLICECDVSRFGSSRRDVRGDGSTGAAST